MHLDSFNVESSWKKKLEKEFKQEYFIEILHFLEKQDKQIYPQLSQVFNAFSLCPFENVKVIILGQDPYHNPGQAMGLSFSVPKTVKIPPSLKNIYKEINRDLSIDLPPHGDLTSWAKQGVFLLNAILTVEHKKAGSHQKIGWQEFTNAVISMLSDQKENLVFMLWGNFAKAKKYLINTDKHLILESAHPSPLARNAFNNNRHFSKCNSYLKQHQIKPINWRINS